MCYDLLHNLWIELFAAENIQIDIPGLVAKVPGDVTCFYQLD
jgi:hypothetical protein